MTRALRAAALLLPLALAASPLARADERLPGEAADLTDDARAKAKAQIDALYEALKLEDEAKRTEAVTKARRALLTLGPAIWPVIENAARLVPPEGAKPHFNLLKALLVKKSEPEFEYLRHRIRRQILIGNVEGMRTEVLSFRVGRPDPNKPSSKIPPTVRPTMRGTTSIYRSEDGTIVVAYGGDATEKNADAPEVVLEEATAGLAIALGGNPRPMARHSGGGGHVSVTAPMGFAFAWAADGANGVRPGGDGGDAGEAEAKGGAGEFKHGGKVGDAGPS